MPFNFCVIKIPFPFAFILLPCAKSQVALFKCPWGFPRSPAPSFSHRDVGSWLRGPGLAGPGSDLLSCCFDTLPPLSCFLPAVVIFLIRIMAFQIISILSWNCKPSLIVDSFLFEWEQPWSLHILMKNLIWKEFALKLLDLENCFLMENDPIFLFHRIMVISPILRDK